MISVVIPARNEKRLAQTVADIYDKFTGEFEVIVILDGDTNFPVPKYHNCTVIQHDRPYGIRKSLNRAVDISSGEYILKVDAHCLFSTGFDTLLRADYEDETVMVARRWTLDLDNWQPLPRRVDYYYLSCPWTHPRPLMMQSCPWITRTEEKEDTSIDELMCFQGSMWFMSREHWDWMGGLETDRETYAEHHEISMKTWLGGRKVLINKHVWYAHPRDSERGYHMNMNEVYSDHDKSARYWTNNEWNKQVHPFDWLIDKFWPLPTEHNRHRLEKYYWPEDWRKYYDRPV